MRKFWKLGLIFGVVAFMAGCSNLWDYVPPPRVDNAPVSSDGASGGGGGGGGGKPSGGGGGSGPTRNVLTFYVDDGSGGTRTITVPKSTPSATTASFDDIKKAFGNVKVPAGFKTGSEKWFIKSTSLPASGNIDGGTLLKLTFEVDDSNNNGFSIDTSNGNPGTGTTNVAKPKSDNTSLNDLVGGANPLTPTAPAGYTFKGWDVNEPGKLLVHVPKDDVGATPSSDAKKQLDNGTTITANFEKTISFSIFTGSETKPYNKTVKYPEPETATLKEIFEKAGVPIADATTGKPTDKVFGGWKVTVPGLSTPIIVTSADIKNGKNAGKDLYPAGTRIEPTWIDYGDGGALGNDRNLTFDKISNKKPGPQVGDGINEDGDIIAKDRLDINTGDYLESRDGTIIGYIYKIQGNVISAVAKEIIGPLRWSGAKDKAATYTGIHNTSTAKMPGLPGSDTSKGDLKTTADGFEAWTIIYNWNTGALFSNYEAIKRALCYPLKTSDVGYPTDNDGVTAIVNGQDVDKRWYLPSLSELKDIYGAGEKLLNWYKDPTVTHPGHTSAGGITQISDKQFWSVNISDTPGNNITVGSYTGPGYTYAKYADFNDACTTKEDDKYNKSHYVIPVARFTYVTE